MAKQITNNLHSTLQQINIFKNKICFQTKLHSASDAGHWEESCFRLKYNVFYVDLCLYQQKEDVILAFNFAIFPLHKK